MKLQYEVGSHRETVYSSNTYEIGITQVVTQCPADKHRREETRADQGMRRRVRATTPCLFLLAAQAKKLQYHFQGLLGGRKEP